MQGHLTNQATSSNQLTLSAPFISKALSVIVAACLVVGAAFVSRSLHGAAWWIRTSIVFLFCIGGLYLAAKALRTKIILDGDQIEVQDAFQSVTVRKSEIEGMRVIEGRNSTARRLYLREGRGTLTIPSFFNRTAELNEWLSSIADLDLRDAEVLAAEMKDTSGFAGTGDEPPQALARAKSLVRGLNIIAVGAFASLLFLPKGVAYWLCLAVAYLIPAIAIALANHSPRFYTLLAKRKDPRANVSGVATLLPFALVFLVMRGSFHIIDIEALAAWTGVFLLLILLAWSRPIRAHSSRGSAFFAACYCGIFYSIALACGIDVWLDRSMPNTYATTVKRKHVDHGKYTTYHLVLDPWPTEPYGDDAAVSHSFYEETIEGEPICVYERQGALHAAWYTIRFPKTDRPCVSPSRQ